MNPITDRLLRPREVAERLAVSPSTVYRWFWEGKLKGIQITGGTIRILESTVEAFKKRAKEGED
jgi:putative resolvase